MAHGESFSFDIFIYVAYVYAAVEQSSGAWGFSCLALQRRDRELHPDLQSIRLDHKFVFLSFTPGRHLI